VDFVAEGCIPANGDTKGVDPCEFSPFHTRILSLTTYLPFGIQQSNEACWFTLRCTVKYNISYFIFDRD